MTNRSELRQYLLILRRWLWLIILCTLLGAGSAFLVSYRATPVYSASATLLVQQAPSSSTSDLTAIRTSELLAQTYAQMLVGRPVMESVIDRMGLQTTPGDLASRVSVNMVQDTQLIEVKVEDTDPARAAQTANTIAQVFITQNQSMQQERYADSLQSMQQQMDELTSLIEETQAQIDALGAPENTQGQAEAARLETILAGYRNTYATLLQNYEQIRLTAAQSADDVLIFESAQVPTNPVRPRTRSNTALAAVTGAMIAVGVAFLIEYLDDTIKTPDDVQHALGLGTLGAIGKLGRGSEELITVAKPLSPISEGFRVLRTNLQFSSVDRPLRTLLVTSAEPLEGKSLTVANLGVTMAQAGLRVAVVDGDLRRSRLHHLFDMHANEGLTQSLLEGSTNGRMQPVEQAENLSLLASGDTPPNPTEVLGSRRMKELLEDLTGRVDIVLIDSPPVLPVADAAVLAQGVDGVILVVEAGKTRRQTAQQAVKSLEQVDANVVGVVLNAVPARGGGYYYYYRYYGGYYHGDGSGRRERKRKRRNGLLPHQWNGR